MQIDPIPIFFDTGTLRLPKIDSAGKMKNQLEILKSYGSFEFPANDSDFQRNGQNAADNSHQAAERRDFQDSV
jgi:hypothetical protein